MEAGGLELRPAHLQALGEDAEHERGFLLLCHAGGLLEKQVVLFGVDRPCGHGQAELNIGFDLPGVGRAVEQPELDRSFGEVGVEIDAVVAGGVVVFVADPAAVPVVKAAVPQALDGACVGVVFLDGLEQIFVGLVAPAVGAVSDL